EDGKKDINLFKLFIVRSLIRYHFRSAFVGPIPELAQIPFHVINNSQIIYSPLSFEKHSADYSKYNPSTKPML
ncbi:MAG: hypothetical protein J7K15_14595, partial [Deltaproteobacteria bacterium]|nr:hypothetical protein [Deltaproteobacteria bacterium]